ncbi:MAG: cyclic nucleotide-binding domain-containing protein [Thermodesulfobacteriota bacterium]
MGDHKKQNETEEPVLKLENEALNNPAPEASEVEIELEASDITIIEESPREATAPAAAKLKAPPSPTGFSTRSFNAGDVIFSEGDPGEEAYLILNGQVKITRQHKSKSMKINQLGEGQIFGEMAIITGEPRTATAEAVEPTEVFIITEQKLNENLSHNLAIVKNLIDQLIDRLKQLLKQQSTMVSKIERSLLVDKKIEKLKAMAVEHDQTGSAGTDEKIARLLQLIREL